MSIFSRRTVQDLLEKASRFLTPQEIASKLHNLEAGLDETIPTEWELAVLVAFSRLGAVIHEPATTATRPDLQFTPQQSSSSLIIDIRTVSDKRLHEENPYELLMEDFRTRLHKAFPDQRSGSFDLQVRPISPMPVHRGARARKKLRLPHSHHFKRTIFNRGFTQFLTAVKAAPTTRHEYVVKSEEADVTIRFDPVSSGLSGGYPVFTLAHSIESNPVARALQKKAKQLKDSKLSGTYGIVLCDGSCDLMTRQRQDDWSSFHLDDVVRHFLANNTSISFVLTLTVLTDRSGYIGPRHLHVQQRLYQNRNYSSLDPEIRQSVETLHTFLPAPARTAPNAKSHLEWRLRAGIPNHGDSFEGGLTLSDRTFKVSLRTIQELLGGRKDVKSFEDMHGLQRNPFLRNLDEGRLIIKVEVEKGTPAEDDDWLIFTFGEPDSAVSPYRPPDPAATDR